MEEIVELRQGKIVFLTWKNQEGWPVKYVSENIYTLFGYEVQELISGKVSYAELIHPEDIDRVSKEVQEAIKKDLEEFTHKEYRIKDAKGFYHTLYDHTKIIRDGNGNIESFSGYIFDETEDIEQRERLSLVLEGTALGLWDWNPQTNDVVFDERWAQMLGYELNEIEPSLESWQSRVHPDDIAGCFEDITKHIEGITKFYNNVHRMKHKDGSWKYILDRGKIVERDISGNPIRFTGTHTDVTKLKEAELTIQKKQLELEKSYRELQRKNKVISRLAYFDGLTKVYNRRHFDEVMESEWERFLRNKINFAILLIDIDYFKMYNDTYGHQPGDKCLRKVASTIKKSASRANDFAARYGGEEFVVFLSDNITLYKAKEIANKICNDVRELKLPHKSSKASDCVSVSIGVSSTNGLSEAKSYKKVLKMADEALYRAKENGRNRACINL